MTVQKNTSNETAEFTPALLSDMLKKIQEGETTATQLEKMLDKIESQMASIIEEMGNPQLNEDQKETEQKPEEEDLPQDK